MLGIILAWLGMRDLPKVPGLTLENSFVLHLILLQWRENLLILTLDLLQIWNIGQGISLTEIFLILLKVILVECTQRYLELIFKLKCLSVKFSIALLLNVILQGNLRFFYFLTYSCKLSLKQDPFCTLFPP